MSSQNLVSRYDITKIASPILSYYQKIVPGDRHERVKFINSILLNAPYLIGLAKRYAALLSGDIDYDAIKQEFAGTDVEFNDKMHLKLDDILEHPSVKYSEAIYSTFFNLYYYPEVVTTVMPLYDYSIVCPGCEKDVSLSDPVGTHFEYTLSLKDLSRKSKNLNRKPQFTLSDAECPLCSHKLRNIPVKYKERKGTVENPNFFIKVWNPFYMSVERGAFRGNSAVYMDMDRFTECYPELYSNGNRYTFATLDNMDYNLLRAIMTGMPYVPNPKYTKVFRNKPDIAGLEDALSPVLLALVALLHTGSLRRGQEADAIIKSSPHIMLTPAAAENSASSTQLDAGEVTSLIMEMVQEIQEGDSTGIMYFPSAVKADKMYTDPRRTILEREIKEEEMSTMITTGLDATVFSGGLPNDPFILYVMNELLKVYTQQAEELSTIVLKQIRNLMGGEISLPKRLRKLPMQRVDRAPGTLADQTYTNLVETGIAPAGPMLSKYGYKSVTQALELVSKETRTRKRIERELDKNLTEDMRTDQYVEIAKGQMSAEMIAKVEQALIPEAQKIAEELKAMEDGQKQSKLHELQMNNMLLYGLVRVKLQELNNAIEREVKAQITESY